MAQEGEPRERGPQRRGAELRRHILVVAKDVFLETGYERASMDTVAVRAGTSKRSLYAHFESKDKLFLAVLDLVRELYLDKLRTPDAYAPDPAEAVALFCARFLQLMVWEPQVRTCRLVVAEAERLPDSAAAYFDAVFATAQGRLTGYLAERYGMAEEDAGALAQDLIGRAVLPRLVRTLLRAEEPVTRTPGDSVPAGQAGLDAIRRMVAAALPS
jgi:AcrR family transcriptional regulator